MATIGTYNFGYVDSENDGDDNFYGADIIIDSETDETRMAILQFEIPTRESLELSSKSYISTITMAFTVTVTGGTIEIYKVKDEHATKLNFKKMTYLTYNQEGNDSTNKKWVPANWQQGHLAVAEATITEGNMLDSEVANTSPETLTLSVADLQACGWDWGSTVTLALYNATTTSTTITQSNVVITLNDAQNKPDAATMTLAPGNDSTTGDLTVKFPNDETIYGFYIDMATSASVSATASADYTAPSYKNTVVNTSSFSGTFTQGVNQYVRVFTINANNVTTDATAGDELLMYRPKIDASGAVLYTDSALSSALGAGKENATLGQKVYLKVTDAAVSTPTGNKYTKIRVNWDSGSSDNDEDYAEYTMQDSVPVLNNGSNVVVSHRYHSAGAKVVKVQVEDENGFRSDKGNITGNQPNVKGGFPTAIISPSRTKVTQAKYGDRTTAVTLSGQQSRTSGSDIVIDHYGWGYTSALSTTIVTANALENDNSRFDDNSKRVKIGALSTVDKDDTVFKIFGLASFNSSGVGVKDTLTTFDHYAYTSATASPLTFDVDARPNIGAVAVDSADEDVYFKEIECVVCTTKASNENNGIYDSDRYILLTNASDEDGSASQVINSDLRYDSNVAANLFDSTDNVGETYTATDEVLTRSVATVTDHPEVIRIDNEDLFIHHESSNDVLVYRGYNNTTATTHASGAAISVYRLASRYRWGGYAKITGSDVDFDDAGTIVLIGVDTENSSLNTYDWFGNGFYVGDIIKVGNDSGSNGTFDDPKYYKIKTITNSGGGNIYDTVTIETDSSNLSEDEQTYISTSLTTDDNEQPVIVRDDSAKKPSITAAIYNTGAFDDTVTFYMGIFDSTQTRFSAQDKSSTTTAHNFGYHWSEDTVDIRAVSPSSLDLDTLADASNIALQKVTLTRSGGISSQMPLGIRRYPVGVVRTKLGIPKVAIQAKALDQTGYRALFSLVEGNRYDYVFLDSKKLDAPTTSYRTLRMRLESGNIMKDVKDPNVYNAALTFVVLGEDVT